VLAELIKLDHSKLSTELLSAAAARHAQTFNSVQRNETAVSFSERCCNEKEFTQNHARKYGIERSACAASFHPSVSIVVHPPFFKNTQLYRTSTVHDVARSSVACGICACTVNCDLHAATAHLHKCAVIRLSLPCRCTSRLVCRSDTNSSALVKG
jgi:hypothetical protein